MNPSQESLTDQLESLVRIANSHGLYDAADFIRDLATKNEATYYDWEKMSEIASSAMAERDELRATNAKLVSALEHTEWNFKLAVNGKPVRDMCENLAENEAALAAAISSTADLEEKP